MLTLETGSKLVLGLETSCDETAASVVVRSRDGHGQILSNIVRTQWEQHRPYGGVVPEIAARAHVECLDHVIKAAMGEAGVSFPQLHGVAASAGPGLIGGLLVGLMTAKVIAMVHDRPLLAINHLEAHALTVGLTDGVRPPYLLLLVSGGHTQLLLVEGVRRYRRLGTTIDDALGEAFDKSAKLMGLPQPGGPAIERAALSGKPGRFKLPRPMHGRVQPDFSFAGLKTAVRHAWEALPNPSPQDVADLALDFEIAIADSVADRVAKAVQLIGALELPMPSVLVVAGGVAANQRLKGALQRWTDSLGWQLCVPPPQLCTDNGAMVAWAGAERLALGLIDALDVAARPRWPLDAMAMPKLGAGRHGHKA